MKKFIIFLILLSITTLAFALSGGYPNNRAVIVREKIVEIPEKIFDDFKITKIDTSTFKIEVLDTGKEISVIDTSTITVKPKKITKGDTK